MPKRPPPLPQQPRSLEPGPEVVAARRLAAVNQIDAGTLIERLQDFALSNQFARGQKVRLTGDQIKSIELLLRKVVPDLNRTTLEGGDPKKPINQRMVHEITFIEATTSSEEK